MDRKAFLIAAVAVFVVYQILNFLVYNVLLADTWSASGVLRPDADMMSRMWLYPDFPKGINTMYPYILRGKLSVRPAQVGGIDVNTLLSKLSWLLRIPNVDRILPLDRGATVR